jgi:murein DD-endopeptidase MepM/ murein hydrolase activator NlpD
LHGLPKDNTPDYTEKQGRYLSLAAWIVAAVLVVLAVYLAFRTFEAGRSRPDIAGSQSPAKFLLDQPAAGRSGGISVRPGLLAALPTPGAPPGEEIWRRPELRTIIPTRPREDVITYTVETGDSVFEIADRFNLTPETVLWGNYALLNDNPDMISVGMELRIPPVDGVLYEWQPQDTLADVAGRFKAAPQDILNWPGNDLDLVNTQIASGSLLMVPGGQREFRQWLIPTIPRGSAGVASSVYGGGACEGGYEGAYGTGTFVWPAGNHIISGNDYWTGHLALDIAAGDGAPIYAADAGVIVFAGWANGGYGNTVMIDHGNGYQTLYGHMSSVTARCGQSVSQGGTIGIAGSTGNSTGTHLHFEVRYQGGFVSPWFVLPAP